MTEKHYSPSSREVRDTMEAEASERYRYFVEVVVGWDEAWGLRDDEGWMAVGGEGDVTCFPLWPAEAYARRAAVDEFASMRPVAIPLDELVNKLLPAWQEQNVAISVFWVPPGKGVVVTAEELSDILRDDDEQ